MGFYGSNGVSIEAHTLGIGPVESLVGKSAASATSAILDAGTVRPNATLVVTTTAGVSAGVVALQASMDATNFWNVPSSSITTSAASTTSAVTSTSAYGRYFRAAVTTTVTGGTVNAWVAASG